MVRNLSDLPVPRLTAPKEDGAAIEYNGKKIALGIPAARVQSGAEAYSYVPLRKPGTPDDAAGAILLYKFLAFMGTRVTDAMFQFSFTARFLCVRAHIGSDWGCWNIIIYNMLFSCVFFSIHTRSRAVCERCLS